jgi:transposase
VKQVAAPRAGKHSRFTLLMESLILSTLQAYQSVSRTSALTGASWDQGQGVMERAVQRGQKRKQQTPEPSRPTRGGVDEKAFRKGHTCMTIACDLDCGTVEHVAADRRTDSWARYFRGLSTEQIESIECIAMDMGQPCIRAPHEHLPLAGEKIVFDRFHVMKPATDAVDKVRRTEHKALRREGDETLKRTRRLWLYAEKMCLRSERSGSSRSSS